MSEKYIARAGEANWTAVLSRLAKLDMRVTELENKLKEKESTHGNDPGTNEIK